MLSGLPSMYPPHILPERVRRGKYALPRQIAATRRTPPRGVVAREMTFGYDAFLLARATSAKSRDMKVEPTRSVIWREVEAAACRRDHTIWRMSSLRSRCDAPAGDLPVWFVGAHSTRGAERELFAVVEEHAA